MSHTILPHGGRLAEARRTFPGAPEPLIDLSTGINPIPWPVPALPRSVFTRLPEPDDEAALCAVAAAAYGAASPSLIAAAPGTQILISLLPRLFPHRRIAVLGPTYAEHAAAWRDAGAAVFETSHLGDLGDADAAVVCNPNNPDGRRIVPAELLALADTLAARGGLLVVDAAFADTSEDISVVPALPHPALIVLRSFGKTYGLAGLRLGFALAAPERISVIRRAFGPWAVSGPALAIGQLALADRDWLDAARLRLDSDTVRLDAVLTEAGLRVIGGTNLFRLAALETATELHDRLGRAGILVRRFAEHPTWLRFGLPGDATAWERLADALV